MQTDFQQTMVVIIAVGTAVFGAGAALLFLAFRAFGTARRGDVKHVVFLVAAIAFILTCCVVLLVWSTLLK